MTGCGLGEVIRCGLATFLVFMLLFMDVDMMALLSSPTARGPASPDYGLSPMEPYSPISLLPSVGSAHGML